MLFPIEQLRATAKSAFDAPDGGIHSGRLLLYLVALHEEVQGSDWTARIEGKSWKCRERLARQDLLPVTSTIATTTNAVSRP